MSENLNERLRELPGIDIILSQDWISEWLNSLGHNRVKEILNAELSKVRELIKNSLDEKFSLDDFIAHCEKIFSSERRRNLRRVINATGIIIHTNLGRSLIADEAVNAISEIAKNYSNLEYDISAGTRGHRNDHVEKILCSLTGAEAAVVVNNNAGAVLLCLFALASKREVIVSRGELVEIGGSFRIPDIMKLSGAVLTEAGTTNRTHLKDYEEAINENTAMLLKVHPSNFLITGFTSSPERKELAELAHRKNLIFMEDAGSGLLIDPEKFLPSLNNETSIKKSLEAGADLVTFSGDKMLGGPQLGIIAGKRELIDKLKKHPMLRALRADKITLAAFEATLKIYMRGSFDDIPTLEMIRYSENFLKEKATKLATRLKSVKGVNDVEVIQTEDAAGGGSCPEKILKGFGVRVVVKNSARLQKKLRHSEIPIICNVHDDALIFHVRTLRNGEDEIITEELRKIFSEEKNDV